MTITAGAAAGVGRHRRVDPDLVVHLVFADLSEETLGPETSVGRSMAELAGLLICR